MLDHFNVIIDTIIDLLNPFYDIAYPIAVILVLISVIIFAWRSTEVSTADEVDGQFTIPGRGTFNVINTDRSSTTNQTRSSTRNRGDRTSSTGSQQETEPETETSTEDDTPDAGDETETEININVRYLDESVMNCSFRPSQSLGHFKLSNWSNEDERKRVCLIYAGKALRDDKIQMRRIGLKEGDTMHAFYKNEPEQNNNRSENGSNSQTRNGSGGDSRNDQFDDDDFDELARYFLPLAGSLLIMTWFYVLSSPIMISVSTLVALLFITLIYTGFAIYNYRSLIF